MSLLLAALLFHTPAEAAPKDKCKWMGGKDEFSSKDSRSMSADYYYGLLNFTVHPYVAEKVTWDIVLRASGAISEPYTKSVKMLLVSGAVVALPADAPAPPVMAATSSGVFTVYNVKSTVGFDTLQQIIDGGGVTKFQLELPTGDGKVEIGKKHYGDLVTLAKCAMTTPAD